MLIAELKTKIEDSLARARQKLDGDCEHCPCAWEDRSYEGECGDCGCHLYKDLSGRRLGCLLPDFVLRAVARRKTAAQKAAEEHAYDGVAEWYEASRRKDELFEKAVLNAMYVDRNKSPVQPLYRSKDGAFHPYATQDGYALARMDYEENLEAGMPRVKAFQKAIAERLCTDLYYRTDDGAYGQVLVFGRSGDAVERYHELLQDAGIEH